ncbi:PQQ-like beta-propeller repeat protein [Roseobacter sp. HKCCA0434]|uniref:PQQ-like beta-propeller repeat protein n=1 Tax=Roseobacter sp. HKCCA0434 TaxID=3079297 RepID=UPI0029058E94|nr:PQQ-binding-like beta-propeller repeat protein [Roseobacter sp. HKCCA0434]
MTLRHIALAAFALSLSGCGFFDREEIVPGERIAVRPAAQADITAPATGLPAPMRNRAWTHEGGMPTHAIPHPALGAQLSRAFSASIGAPSRPDAQITSGPVGNTAAIYTLDSQATVTATSPSGARLWSRSLVPEGDRAEDGFGGGVALGEGKVFVTTGFGEIFALDAASGAIQWQQQVGAPFRAPPTVFGPRVIAVGRDDVARAFDAGTGQLLWRLTGARGDAGVLGGAQAATDGQLVILPFSSGELVGAFARNGRRAWAAAMSTGRRGLARSSIGDVTGDPVFAETDVIAGNQSGTIVSIDPRSGRRNWTHGDGAQDAPLVVGQAIFAVTDQAELIRLDRASGAVVWRRQLAERNPRDRDLAARYTGPVIAGGRLFVANGHDGVEVFDPATGAALGRLDISRGVAAAPAVIDGTLYVLSNEGALVAFR